MAGGRTACVTRCAVTRSRCSPTPPTTDSPAETVWRCTPRSPSAAAPRPRRRVRCCTTSQGARVRAVSFERDGRRGFGVVVGDAIADASAALGERYADLDAVLRDGALAELR